MASKQTKALRRQETIAERGIIALNKVSMSYQGDGAPALDDISLRIDPGEFVFVVGDSGSGKTTLIKLLLRELVPTSGDVCVMGYNTKKLRHRQIPEFRRNIGVVFQDFRLLKDRNVYENVAFAQRIIEVPTREMKKNVPGILSMVGLAGRYRYNVTDLSGGEQQRVALARALVNKPEILLADEPTGNLDPNNAWEIMDLLEEINEQGTTVIVVTHNPEIVNAMKKRVIAMRKGIIVSDEEEGTYVNED
jgi:cell division transport system ATP-binding protein